MAKSPDAFRTISEVAEWLGVPTHVLRFWESRFSQIKPVKRAGGRRYYRPADMELLAGIKQLLHDDGLTIRGVQKVLREDGVRHVAALSPPVTGPGPAAGTPRNVTPGERGNVVPLAKGRDGGRPAADPEAALNRWPFVDDPEDAPANDRPDAASGTSEDAGGSDAASVEAPELPLEEAPVAPTPQAPPPEADAPVAPERAPDPLSTDPDDNAAVATRDGDEADDDGDTESDPMAAEPAVPPVGAGDAPDETAGHDADGTPDDAGDALDAAPGLDDGPPDGGIHVDAEPASPARSSPRLVVALHALPQRRIRAERVVLGPILAQARDLRARMDRDDA